jgi:hypothetical protein
VELPSGNFILRLARMRADVIFSATMSWSTLLQYDNVTESIGINTRLHWIPEAGREAFIVLNHPQMVDVVAAAVALERLGVRAAPLERLDQLEPEAG